VADDVVFASAWGRCIRLPKPPDRPRERYAILTAADGCVLGELRWSGRAQAYVLVPAERTVWGSGMLSEVGVWLRRLSRQL
jgi:hypothetical protein